jgi:hypothetical protein
MRNEAGLALPVLFTWKVARAGYRWIDAKGGRFLCAVDALQPDWHNLFERYETTYRPLEQRTGLFGEFANLEPTERDVLAFEIGSGCLRPVAISSSIRSLVPYQRTEILFSFGKRRSRASNTPLAYGA